MATGRTSRASTRLAKASKVNASTAAGEASAGIRNTFAVAIISVYSSSNNVHMVFICFFTWSSNSFPIVFIRCTYDLNLVFRWLLDQERTKHNTPRVFSDLCVYQYLCVWGGRLCCLQK